MKNIFSIFCSPAASSQATTSTNHRAEHEPVCHLTHCTVTYIHNIHVFSGANNKRTRWITNMSHAVISLTHSREGIKLFVWYRINSPIYKMWRLNQIHHQRGGGAQCFLSPPGRRPRFISFPASLEIHLIDRSVNTLYISLTVGLFTGPIWLWMLRLCVVCRVAPGDIMVHKQL